MDQPNKSDAKTVTETGTETRTKESLTWQEARTQPRVRPQWDPKEKANALLDDLEREGRLFRRADR